MEKKQRPRLTRRSDLIAPPEETERFVDILDAHQRHPHALSLDQVKELVCPHVGDTSDLSAILKAAYHHGYLDRKEELHNTFVRRVVTTLGKEGEKLLAAKERLFPYRPPKSNDPWHDHGVTCATASFEIEQKTLGHQHIYRNQIIAKAPASTQSPAKRGKYQPTPFEVPVKFQANFKYKGHEYSWPITKPYEADDLLGDRFNNAETYGFLEFDNDNEDGFSSDPDKNSIVLKLLRIQHLVTTRRIFEHFNIPNAVFLFLTTSETREKEILALVHHFLRLPRREGGGHGSSYIAVSHVPRIPKLSKPPIFADLGTREWKRAGTDPFVLIK